MMKKTKQVLLVALSTAMLFCFLSAYGSQPASAASQSSEKIILKLGDTQPEGHPMVRSYHDFAKRVAELTNGRVEVQIFPSSALGNHLDMLQGIQLGTLQITKCMSTDLSAYFPEVQVFGLPYIFSSREHMFRVVDGEIGDYFAKEVFAKEDMIALCWFDGGSRCVYNSKRPIKTVEDMKGLLLRVPENPIYMATIAAFGATGTPMAMGDIYTSLQTGVIDGAENAYAVYESQKHYEAAPYFSYTDHLITPDVVIMKRSYLESLPEDIQKAIWTAAAEMEQIERKYWIESEDEYYKKLLAAGVKFNEVDKSGFREAAKSVWEKFAKEIGQDLIDKVQALAD